MSTYYTRLLQFSQQFLKFYHYRFESLLTRTGLSMREVHVLLFLANNPEYDTARDICTLRGLSKSQVSQAVDLLAAEGLLLRTPDRNDRRIVHLRISKQGRPLAEECVKLQDDCIRRLVDGLSEKQKVQLQGLLETVLDNGAKLEKELLA